MHLKSLRLLTFVQHDNKKNLQQICTKIMERTPKFKKTKKTKLILILIPMDPIDQKNDTMKTT